MKIRILLGIHGLAALAAGCVLIVAPGLIPQIAGVTIEASAYFVCYLLAACELTLAYLSFIAIRLEDVPARRYIIQAFIILHVATALLELFYLSREGMNYAILLNSLVRVVVAGLFTYYLFGMRPRSK